MRWFRDDRAKRGKRVKSVIRMYYRPKGGSPKLSSTEDVKAEIKILSSEASENKEKAARTLGAIATKMWKSHAPSDDEYTWLKMNVSNIRCLLFILNFTNKPFL